jgi:hypothetical protein
MVVVLRDRSPLAFDCVGTCYTDKRRPAPMSLMAVQAQRARYALGLVAVGWGRGIIIIMPAPSSTAFERSRFLSDMTS